MSTPLEQTPKDEAEAEAAPAPETVATVESVATVAVLGAGTMGLGIAQVAAAAGFRVVLRDLGEDLLARALGRIDANLSKAVSRGKMTEDDRARALSNISTTTSMGETAGAGLFVEAVPERLELKRETLRAVEQLNAAAMAVAACCLPEPGGPESSQACAGAPEET